MMNDDDMNVITQYSTLNDAIKNEIISPLENSDFTPVEDFWDIDSISNEAIECKTVHDENGIQIDNCWYQLKPVYNNPDAFWELASKYEYQVVVENPMVM